jgi:nucleoside-diphosphate-sugar epimerase
MRIFVAGASGALGSRLVPQLVERGHEVVGSTTNPKRTEAIARAGAEPVVVDGLDRDAVVAAVRAARPDVVVHEMTALKGFGNPRTFERDFELTNRLRSEGTDHLLAGARAAGARRFVAQSYAGWPYARTGGPVKTEDDPLDPDPPKAMRGGLDAMRHLEAAVTGAEDLEGVVLRYGGFYGPGTGLDEGQPQLELIRKRRFPVVGDGAGVWSFVHVDDAASATVAAIEGHVTGIFNVVDDEPARVSEWLPALAEAIGAPPPRRVPAWLGRIAAGPAGVVLMNESRGASNAKAKRELGWRPRHPTWREGFRTLAAACRRARSRPGPRRGPRRPRPARRRRGRSGRARR